MSDHVYLVLAVAGTFAAAVFGGVTVMATGRGRRSTQVLQAQLQGAGIELARDRRQGSVGERLVSPLLGRVGALVSRFTPDGVRRKVERQLVLAGSPPSRTAERVIAVKVLGGIAGAALGFLFGGMGNPRMLGYLWIPLLALIGYALPGASLVSKGTHRQEEIRRTLPDTIDLLTISVEAGLAFDGALLHVRRTMKGALSEEIGRMLHEIQLGIARIDAFRHLADRTDVQELRSFVLAMVQADIFGVSIANVLRAQSQELRTKRRQRAEERAMKTPVKLLFPMILCILPALLVLVIGPGAIQIVKTLGGS